MSSKNLQVWDNSAFDDGESEGSAAIKFSGSAVKPLPINLTRSFELDSIKENLSSSMVESPVSVKPLVPIKPLNPNSILANTQTNPTSKVGTLERKIHENVDQGCPGKENFPEERNIDLEIKEIEEEINRLCLRLESLRLEKAKRNAKEMEKRSRVVEAKFLDLSKKSSGMIDELRNIEESLPMCAKLKTPRRELSLGPMEIISGTGRRGISLGPAEIYSATKLKQLGKQEMITPVQPNSNRRKFFYWKHHEIDELRATKERGKRLSLSPKSQSKTVQFRKQAATTIGYMKMRKKEDGLISSIKPKKLFVKDCEKSATAKKSLKSGRVVASSNNQISNGGNSIIKEVKELRKRSLPENEEDFKRSDKKRVSLAGKSQGKERPGTETRVKMWEIPNEVAIQKGVVHKIPLSVSKILDKFPKIKTLRCVNESPGDSGSAKRASDLVGRKSYFNIDNVNENKVDESVCQAFDFAEQFK